MRARVAPWLVFTALACAPGPQPTQVPPERPVLRSAELPILTHVSQWRLEGSAPPDTVVRIHLDDACRGPALSAVTPERLRLGIDFDLAAGVFNVFTAIAIDVHGVASECSSPLRVRYDRPPVPQRPVLSLSPEGPTRETHFAIHGVAEDAFLVRLFDGSACSGVPRAVLSVEDFTRSGFAVDVQPNTASTFVADALNLTNDRSSCSPTVTLFSDQQGPSVFAFLRSPVPSPGLRAFVQVSNNAARGTVFLGDECQGPAIGVCEALGCLAVEVEFPASPMAAWSAIASDPLGNLSACAPAPQPWWFDLNTEEPAIRLEVNTPWLRGLVPASSRTVVVYDGPACDDAQERARVPGAQVAGVGVYLQTLFGPTDGGLVSARGTDGITLFPCSNPVTR